MSDNLISQEPYFEELFEAVKEGNREKFRDLFLTLHERDQQELFHLLYPERKRKIADFLTPSEFAEIFEYMDVANQEDAVTYLPKEYLVEVFNELPTDILASFVLVSDEPIVEELLLLMDRGEENRLREILSYEYKSAGSIMTKEYFFVYEEYTTQEVIERIRKYGERAETIYYLYVVDNRHHLVGVLSLRDLLITPEDTKVKDVMNSQVVTVYVDEDQEEVADIIQDYDLIAIPVITHEDRLVGIITIDDIMDIVELESDEDFQEFAGISSAGLDDVVEITPSVAAKKRIPWIIILLFLSMITGGLIGFFESTLASVVSLAAFIPLIMGAAGNVGTQSLAVSLRNMDDEEKPGLSNVLRNEMITGGMIGIAAGIVIFSLVAFLYRDIILAFIVGISILISITLAAVVGTFIPYLINKLNFDPAVASGPFITTINDTLGLLIYFIIATSLIQFL